MRYVRNVPPRHTKSYGNVSVACAVPHASLCTYLARALADVKPCVQNELSQQEHLQCASVPLLVRSQALQNTCIQSKPEALRRSVINLRMQKCMKMLPYSMAVDLCFPKDSLPRRGRWGQGDQNVGGMRVQVGQGAEQGDGHRPWNLEHSTRAPAITFELALRGCIRSLEILRNIERTTSE
jgi:hypothetical protein